MTALFVSLVLAYLLGSISPSYLFGKLLKGIDLREHGSGNVGATNVFRVLGKGPGVVTLLIDVGKGFFAIRPMSTFFETSFSIPMDPLLYQILLGCAVISGHNWTVFLKFKGGKGVATGCGVLLALAPLALLWGALAWLLVSLLSREVGLGSLTGSLVLPFAMVFLKEPPLLIFFGFLMTVSTFYTHRSNIKKVFFNKNHKGL